MPAQRSARRCGGSSPTTCCAASGSGSAGSLWSLSPASPTAFVRSCSISRLATTVRPGLRERLAGACEDAAGDAYLVAKSRQDEFAAAVAELEAEGYELRVTGPWPPYSFARLP